MLPPILFGPRGPGAYLGSGGGGGGGGGGDGGFIGEPIVSTTASGNVTISGKIKPGAFGKFVYPLASIAADRVYTFRYTPHFTQLTQQGKLAMVGFGLKNGNDFHIIGLRGDGASGLKKYKVHGTPPNGWNKDTGHTTVDGGASANGTQAGPNYIRLVTSLTGTTVYFQTSGDSGATWTTEFSASAPTPFSNVSGATTFGIALWFNNADTGVFSIDIDQFADSLGLLPFVFSGALVNLTGDTADANVNTDDAVLFSAEVRDTAAIHSTSVDTGRLTIPAGLDGALVIVHAEGWLVHSAAVGDEHKITIRKNGSESYDGAGQVVLRNMYTTISAASIQTQPIFVATGDYFELYMEHGDTLVSSGTIESDYTCFGLWVVAP